MIIIFPHEGVELSEFEKKLNEENLNNVLLSNVEKTGVNVYIPSSNLNFKLKKIKIKIFLC